MTLLVGRGSSHFFVFLEKSLIVKFLHFKLHSVFLTYLGLFKSKSLIQGHFWKLEIKSFHLAPRFMGFYSLLMKILALEKTKTTRGFEPVACTRQIGGTWKGDFL